MSISFKGFNEQVITFNTASELEAGTLVKMSDSATVAACADGDGFIGAVVSCRGKLAAVQVGGYITVPYSGAAPALGLTAISCADANTIKGDTNGITVTVIELNETAQTAGILL